MSNTYSPAWKNHENFSYANNKNILQAPSGFNTQQRLSVPQPQMSQSRALVTNSQQEQQQIQPAAAQRYSQFDEILAYLKRGEERNAKHDARLDTLENQNLSTQTQMRFIKTHTGQLAQTVHELKQQSLPNDTLSTQSR